MHCKLLPLFLLIVFQVFQATAQNRIKWVHPNSLDNKNVNTEKYYFLYFYYTDCKWCKHLESTTFVDDYTAKFINQKFYPVKINAVGDDRIEMNGQVYRSMRVGKFDFNELAVVMLNGKMSFPAIVILNENFQKIGVHQNYYNVDDFQMILAYYVGGHYKKTLFKYYSQNYCKDYHFYTLVSDH